MGRQVECTECGKREDKEIACGWKGICQPKIRFQVLFILDVYFSLPRCFFLILQVSMPQTKAWVVT